MEARLADRAEPSVRPDLLVGGWKKRRPHCEGYGTAAEAEGQRVQVQVVVIAVIGMASADT